MTCNIQSHIVPIISFSFFWTLPLSPSTMLAHRFLNITDVFFLPFAFFMSLVLQRHIFHLPKSSQPSISHLVFHVMAVLQFHFTFLISLLQIFSPFLLYSKGRLHDVSVCIYKVFVMWFDLWSITTKTTARGRRRRPTLSTTTTAPG